MHNSCVLFFVPKVIGKKKPKRSSRRNDRAIYTFIMLTDAYYKLAAANGLIDRQNRHYRCLVINTQLHRRAKRRKTRRRPLCD